MTRVLHLLWRMVKWLVVAILGIEILSFAVITFTNLMLYGHLREGPRAVYDAYTLFQMPDGFRPTANVVTAPPDPERGRLIWFFGGSTMRASDGPVEKTIASIVMRELNATAKPYTFDCLNLGINSYNSLLEVKLLQKEFIEAEKRPDLVAFYDGANDSNYFAVQKNRYAHEGRERAQAVIESYYKSAVGLLKPLTAAYYTSFTRELGQKLFYTVRAVDPADPELAAFVDLTVKRYDFIAHLCASYDIPFVLFWQPLYWTETCKEINPEVAAKEDHAILGRKAFPHVRDNFMLVYGALERALANRPYFVPLRDALCGRAVPVYTADGVHNTEAGREAIAAALLPALRARLSLNQLPVNGVQP